MPFSHVGKMAGAARGMTELHEAAETPRRNVCPKTLLPTMVRRLRKTLCHDIHSHDTESGQGSAPYLTSTLALPSCFTLGQKLERVSALGTHLTSTLRPPWIYSPRCGLAFSLRPCRSYTAVFLLFVPQQRAVCGLACGLHLDLRRATVIK